jgi:hypothetical protein
MLYVKPNPPKAFINYKTLEDADKVMEKWRGG